MPVTANLPVVVELAAVSPVNAPLVAVKLGVKKLVTVAFVAVRLDTIVFPSVDVPRTNKVPVVDALPFAYSTKLEFCTQDEPFQYKVEFVAVPSTTVPATVVQNVDVPFDAR